MEDWKEYKLKDVCEVINGRAYKQEELLEEGKYRVLRVGNIFQGNNWYYSDLELPEDKYCNKGDLLYAWSCGFAPYIWEGEKTIYHYHIWKLVEDKNIVDKHFLYYYLIENTKNYLGGTHGSVMLHLTKKDMEGQIIKLPSLSNQRKFASILKSLDDKIEVNRRINENLELQAQALFKSWFVDFEPFKDGEFVESELGMIPKGWRVGTLEEIGDVIGGSTPSKASPEYYTENGIAWLTPKDLSVSNAKFTAKGEFDITQEGYNSCSTKLMPRGTVLFSSRAPIGYITIAKNEICTNQGFKSVVPDYAGTAFIYCYLKAATPDIENKATGSTFKEASGSLMKSLQLVVAPKDIMNSFEKSLKPIFDEQECIEDESRRLATLRDTLLPKLMSGELKVNDMRLSEKQ